MHNLVSSLGESFLTKLAIRSSSSIRAIGNVTSGLRGSVSASSSMQMSSFLLGSVDAPAFAAGAGCAYRRGPRVGIDEPYPSLQATAHPRESRGSPRRPSAGGWSP